MVAGVLATLPLSTSIPVVVANAPEQAWGDRDAQLNAFQGYGWALGLVLDAVWTGVGGQFASTLAGQQSFFVACAAFGVAGGLVLVGAGVVLVASRRTRAPRLG